VLNEELAVFIPLIAQLVSNTLSSLEIFFQKLDISFFQEVEEVFCYEVMGILLSLPGSEKPSIEICCVCVCY
jgi:hypothetical protein